MDASTACRVLALDVAVVENGVSTICLTYVRKSNFIQLETPTTLYERGDKPANAISRELKVLPRL